VDGCPPQWAPTPVVGSEGPARPPVSRSSIRSILVSLPCCCCCCVVACARGRLTERDQKWDRTTAEEVLKLSMALGYKLRRTRMAGRHGPAAPEAEHVNAALAAGVVLAAPGPLALGGRVRGGRCHTLLLLPFPPLMPCREGSCARASDCAALQQRGEVIVNAAAAAAACAAALHQ
jgi:hypothetical protein